MTKLSLRAARVGAMPETLMVFSELDIVKIIQAMKQSAPDLVTRCLICAYRGYRQLYKRRYQQFPDDDVADDFNTNSEASKVKSPVKQRERSPVRQTAPVGDTSGQLYQGFKDFMMGTFATGEYANIMILEWLSNASRDPSLYLGLVITRNVAIDLFHPVWYLPTKDTWNRFNGQGSKYSLKELSEFHYLDARL